MNPKVLVAGIGNIFLGDDAFGVEVVQRLARRELPEGVTVRDFGIRSFDLAYALMEQWDMVILVDALPCGGEPGTLCTLDPDLPDGDDTPPDLDAHTMNPVAVLKMVSALGGRVGRMLVVGCEPATVEANAEGHMGLSVPVAVAVDEAVRMVEQIIARVRSETTTV